MHTIKPYSLDKKEAHAWSRHYDLLHWTLFGFYLTGLGLLYIEGVGADASSANPDAVSAIATPFIAFYMCSFRSFRRKVHSCLPLCEEEALRASPGFRQRHVSMAIVLLLNSFAYVNLVKNGVALLPCPWLVVLGVLSNITIIVWHLNCDTIPVLNRK